MDLVVIIPAYNESKVIADVLKSIPKKINGIKKITPIVVDDNSSDTTQIVAEANGAICLRHNANLGAGGATLTGFEAAKKLHADIIVTMDGDGQHRGEDMIALTEPIISGEADVVLGTRLQRDSKEMPFYKKIGNNLLNIVTYVFFGIWVSDSQSGYRAFSSRAVRSFHIMTTGYEFCSEVIGEIKRNHLSYKEVPIATVYTDYSKAKGQLALNAINIVLGLLLRKFK